MIKWTDKDKGFKALKDLAKTVKTTRVQVGLFGNGEPREAGDTSPYTNLEIGLVHEFGSKDGRIPERAPLRTTFDAHKEEYNAAIRKLAGKLIDKPGAGVAEVKHIFDLIGAKFASDIKKTIKAGLSPPNADSTVNAKGSDVPLIDTGQLINAYTWRTEVGEE